MPVRDGRATSDAAGTILIERYPDGFDLAGGGGVHVACFHLAHALDRIGLRVGWYTSRDWNTVADLEDVVTAAGADMVLPLIDSPTFAKAAGTLPPALRGRMVRLWHDVSLLAIPTHPIPLCGQHGPGGSPDIACAAATVSPGAYAGDVFFFDDAWTRCFPRRRYVPWAVDHLPKADHRSPDGPVVLLIGKMRWEYAEAILNTCSASGIPVRAIFSNWSVLGQQSRYRMLARAPDSMVEVIDRYDLARDHARVFGGASAALVLSQYRETFNFVAAEAAYYGLPVIAFAGSGAVRRFASVIAADVPAVLELLGSGRYARLRPVACPDWGWSDVAAAYADMVGDLRRSARVAAAQRPAGEVSRWGC